MNEPKKTLTARQKAHLQRLADTKVRLLDSIDGLDQAALCNECVMGDWTIKDILGHIVSWNEEFRADIEIILQDKHPGYERQISGEDDFNEWNQQWRDRKRSWSLERILADIERDYQEAIELILLLRPEDYMMSGVTPWKQASVERPEVLTKEDTDSVETLVTFHWRHMNQHTQDLEKWRKRVYG